MFEELERINYQLGETIFRQDEKGDCAYMIERGSVELSVYAGNKIVIVRELEAGELFGEMALFKNQRRFSKAMALEKTCVVKINRDLIEAKLAKTDPVITHLLRLTLRRLRQIHYKFNIDKNKR